MNKEEIDYWLKFFCNKPICYKSGEDKEISFAKVFMEFKELQQEKEKLKEIIKENTILVKDEYGDYQECNINPLEMKQKYDKQVDNWNKLKNFLKTWEENEKYCYLANSPIDRCRKDICGEILEKIQELEQGDLIGK